MRNLEGDDRVSAIAKLDGWHNAQDRNAIEKVFKFKNFNAAFGFMTRVAMKAETMDHHPEWSNVYNTVSVVLTTHTTNGVTELDITLASYMNKISA